MAQRVMPRRTLPRPHRVRRVAGAGLLAALVAPVAVIATLAQVPESRNPTRLRPGIFLYASPDIGDPRFVETIVLLLEHGAGGSAGVVVNQPSETQLRKVLPDMPEARRLELPVYWGGPVEPEGTVVLLRNPRRTSGTSVVLPEVHRTRELEALRAALEDPRPDRQVRVYSGYAGWSPGQLAEEVRLGAWLLDRADADAVFALDPAPLWNKVRSILKRREARAHPTRALSRELEARGS
jgi:putative transcriptional regulator